MTKFYSILFYRCGEGGLLLLSSERKIPSDHNKVINTNKLMGKKKDSS